MKKFDIEKCTKEEFEIHRKCWKTKQELWDLVNKFYYDTYNEKIFEEHMLIIEINRIRIIIDIINHYLQ